jgi:hypothetical protein
MKRTTLVITILLAGLSLASCKYQKNNRKEQTDLRAGDPTVYGVHPDSAAAQTKLTYSTTPELDQRTIAIREKMFGSGSINSGN